MKATTEVQKSKVSDVGILGGAQVSKADILLGAVLSMPWILCYSYLCVCDAVTRFG